MANDNTIKTFTATDIAKYHKGLLSPREMHAMEKAALDDPFLADALEGYTVPGVNAEADVAELKKRLQEKTSNKKVIPIAATNKSFPWMRAAAMFVLIAGAGFLVYKFGFTGSDTENIAANKTTPAAQSTHDSIRPNTATNGNTVPVTDSISSGDITSERKTGTEPINSQAAESVINATDGIVSQKAYGQHLYDGVNDQLDTVKTDDAFGRNATAKTIPIPQSNSNWTQPLEKPNADKRINLKHQPGYQSGTLPVMRDSVQFNGLVYNRTDAKKKESNDEQIRIRGTNSNYSQGFANATRHNVFRGRVTDANNNALPFANITNTYDNVGTYSDAKGNFTLISTDSVLNVQVRSVGFENSQNTLVSGPRDNQIIMQEDNRSLGEVVINSNRRSTNASPSRNNTIVHEEPEPVDGWVNYDIYVANNLKTPDTLMRVPTQRGYVELSFDVNKNGEPVNITIDKSLCESCDKEAVRLLKEGPKWKQKSKRKKRTSVTISF